GTPIHVALVNALGEPVAPKNSMRERNPRYGRGGNRAATAADTPPANG
ncbi:MAG: transcriptional regulator, partial [Ralstonia pickettii]|nr:transcriptional regulator [Ralstonia pickettii]